MPTGPAPEKIVSWDETCPAWLKAMPRALRRSCTTTRMMGLMFGHLARQVRMGLLPVYHTPAWLPFPTTQDSLYGPLGRYLQASDILQAFDDSIPAAPAMMRTALIATLESLPDRGQAPTPRPFPSHGIFPPVPKP